MADFEAIRRGLAALLKDALPGTAGHASPWLAENPIPTTLCVAGVAPDGIEYLTFGSDPTMQIDFVVEAWLGLASEVAAQRTLDGLLSSDALAAALEVDQDSAGALTKRLNDDGTVSTGQTPAADSVSVQGYQGQQRLQTASGVALVATWLVRVIA